MYCVSVIEIPWLVVTNTAILWAEFIFRLAECVFQCGWFSPCGPVAVTVQQNWSWHMCAGKQKGAGLIMISYC